MESVAFRREDLSQSHQQQRQEHGWVPNCVRSHGKRMLTTAVQGGDTPAVHRECARPGLLRFQLCVAACVLNRHAQYQHSAAAQRNPCATAVVARLACLHEQQGVCTVAGGVAVGRGCWQMYSRRAPPPLDDVLSCSHKLQQPTSSASALPGEGLLCRQRPAPAAAGTLHWPVPLHSPALPAAGSAAAQASPSPALLAPEPGAAGRTIRNVPPQTATTGVPRWRSWGTGAAQLQISTHKQSMART